jgi:integrase
VQPAKAAPGAHVFVGRTAGTGLSNMSLSAVLKRMGQGSVTVHGFRSSFRDWVSEATDYPRDIAETALAHTLRDKVEAAYRRGDMLEKRRAMMNDWAKFLAGV